MSSEMDFFKELRVKNGGKCFWRFSPAKEARKSPSKLRRKFATNFAENFANFILEIAGASLGALQRHVDLQGVFCKIGDYFNVKVF